MSEPHILTVIAEVPHVVDDYGTEVCEAEVRYRLECPGITGECEGLIECDCTHPDDDERFEGAEKDSPLWEAYSNALGEYEDKHPLWGWELSGDCWAQSALCDWEPDEPWAPGRYPVRVQADTSWGEPSDAVLILTPAVR